MKQIHYIKLHKFLEHFPKIEKHIFYVNKNNLVKVTQTTPNLTVRCILFSISL